MTTDQNKESNSPKTIVCRVLSYEDKVKILKNAKKVKGKKDKGGQFFVKIFRYFLKN